MKPWAAFALMCLLLVSCSPKEEFERLDQAEPSRRATTARATRTPTATPAPGELSWESCSYDYECATLEVPLDYSGAVEGTMEVPLLRVAAADRDERLGVLLVNPGGPGGSGVDYVAYNAESWPAQLRRFDIIGFDPRGVSGETAVDCTDDLDDFYAADASPDTPEEIAELQRVHQEFAQACEERSGEYLPFLGGDVVVQDIDRIREALGEEQISFLGLSYGTYLGAKYADRYPERVRAFVLDGATDPQLPGSEWQKQQALGFEIALGAFLADCASRPACPFHSGGDPGAAFDGLMARIDAEPLWAGRRTLGPPEAETAVIGSLYNKEHGWPQLALGLALAEAGDGSELLDVADQYVDRNPDGSYNDFAERYRAITCMDLSFPDDLAGFEAMAAELEAAAPRFGAALAWEHLDCMYWPAEAPDPAPVRAAGAPPILVVGTSRDPATPLVWAESLAEQLESGVLLVLEGDGHVAFTQSECIDDAIVRYLVDLKPPRPRTVCQG
jgi:pimeloyl-ACP methyl ester carboxylesterase